MDRHSRKVNVRGDQLRTRIHWPYADRIKGSAYQNLKELRPTSRADEALRVLFYFDRRRNAVLLVGRDKSGNWARWYDEKIPVQSGASPSTCTGSTWMRAEGGDNERT